MLRRHPAAGYELTDSTGNTGATPTATEEIPFMNVSAAYALAKRAARHLLVERSYARYYSADGWEKSYQDGYVLGEDDQDARYGCLLMLLRRYDRGGPILDVGCGEGLLQERFRPFSSSPLIGVDYS
ncbi:MAG: hypothetical protein ACREIC_22685 [Limisphaerales bacterium]